LKRAEQIFAIFLATLSAYIIYGSLQMPYFTEFGPGPGFLPMWSAIILLAVSLGLIVKSFKFTQATKEFITSEGLKRILSYFVLLMIAVLVLERAGLLLAMAVFCGIVSKYLDGHKWRSAAGVAVAATVISYFIFQWWLNIPLPGGLLYSTY